MSEDKEKKIDDFDFDFSSLAGEGTPPNDTQDYGIFAGVAPEAEEPAAEDIAENATEGIEDTSGGLSNLFLEKNTEELTDKTPAEPAPAHAEDNLNFPPVVSLEKEGKAEKDKKSKKQKTEKPKKEKKPSDRVPLALDGILCLLFILLLLGALIAYNVFVVMNSSKDVGFNSTIYYLVGVDVFGLFGLFVPLGFFMNKEKPDIPESKTEIFKVALGASTIAVSVGAILLLSELYRYDFETKPAGAVPSVSMPSAEPNLNQ